MTGTSQLRLRKHTVIALSRIREGECLVEAALLVSTPDLPSHITPQQPYTDYMVSPQGNLRKYLLIWLQIYTQGSSDNFDCYANITNDSGWGWENIKTYIPKVLYNILKSVILSNGHPPAWKVESSCWSTWHKRPIHTVCPQNQWLASSQSPWIPNATWPEGYGYIKRTSWIPLHGGYE